MFSKTRNVVLTALGLSLVAGYVIAGPVLYKLPIGLANLPTLGLGLLGILLAIAVASFVAVRASVRARRTAVDSERRSFLTGAGAGAGVALGSLVLSAAGAAARGLFGIGSRSGSSWAAVGKHINDREIAFTHDEWKPEWKANRIRSHRRFGRTGWNVSDIVLGTGRIAGENGERIAREAIDRGVNYFDTSPDYSGTGSEQVMGRAIQGVRDRMFIATKFCTPTGHLPTGSPVSDYMEVVEGSLKRLGTDYVDLCHIHSCDEIDRLMDPNVHEAFDRLREQGKVRFLGFSTHTPNLVQVANTAIDSGRFDVMMLAYHHGMWAPLDDIVARGRREQDMGVVAMKTLKGAKHHGLAGFREEADSYVQAALKWTLSNPDVSCAVISFFELQHVDEYLGASGKALTPSDLAVLQKYDREILGSYCAPHCGVCLDSCPEGLPIHDVLRHRMYFEDYGWEKEGMRLYAKLEKDASVCASCSAPCLGTCPVGIPIQERMTGAHDLLTLA